MISLQDLTPEIYYKQSRDFQLLGRLYDVVLNSVKTSADALYLLPFADDTMQTRRLDLLAYTLGFTAKHEYSNTQLAAVCSVFPQLLKLKGSIAAIQLLGDTLLSSEGITEQFNCLVDGTTVQLFIPTTLSSTTLLNDLLDYLLPAGMSCTIARATVEAIDIATEIELAPSGVHIFYNENEEPRVDLASLSVIPTAEQINKSLDKSKRTDAAGIEYTPKTTWYTSDENELIAGSIGNSAILDYGKILGLTFGSESSLDKATGGRKLFYDIKYELALTDTLIKGLIDDSGNDYYNLNCWCKKAGVAYSSTPNEISLGDSEAILKTNLAVETNSENDCLSFSVGTRLANSNFVIPEKKLLEKVYGSAVNIKGYTVEIYKAARDGSRFTFFNKKTWPIVNLLDKGKAEQKESLELTFTYNKDNLLSSSTLVTEPIASMSTDLAKVISKESPTGNYIDPAKNLGAVAAEVWKDQGQVCASYYKYDEKNQITAINQLINSFDNDKVTFDNALAKDIVMSIASSDNKVINYPVYTTCFADKAFTAYQLPQLYFLELLDGEIDRVYELTEKYSFIIRPDLEIISVESEEESNKEINT